MLCTPLPIVDDVTEKGLKFLKTYVARNVLDAVNRVVSRVRRKAEDINGEYVGGRDICSKSSAKGTMRGRESFLGSDCKSARSRYRIVARAER